MILKFAFSTNALAVDNPAKISRLLNIWESYGDLNHCSQETQTIYHAIRNLQQSHRDMWIQAIMAKANNRKGREFAQAFVQSELVEAEVRVRTYCPLPLTRCAYWKSEHEAFDILLVSKSCASMLGLDLDSTIAECRSGVEFCELENVVDSNKIRHVSVLSQASISEGVPIEEIWSQRLCGLAQGSENVVIVDRYAFEYLGNSSNGIYRFLRLIDRDTSVKSVTIYSRVPNHTTSSEIRHNLATGLS